MQLVFRERGALYAAYMPLLAHGGIFVPTTRAYQLGDDVYLLLTLPDDPQRYPVAGKVAWITPGNATGGRTQGVRRRLPFRCEDKPAQIEDRRIDGRAAAVDKADADRLADWLLRQLSMPSQSNRWALGLV